MTKPMRSVLALLWILVCQVLAFCGAVLLIDHDGSISDACAAEGVVTLAVCLVPGLATLAVLAWARATSRLYRIAHWIGFPVLNCDLIREEEAHGLTSAD